MQIHTDKQTDRQTEHARSCVCQKQGVSEIKKREIFGQAGRTDDDAFSAAAAAAAAGASAGIAAMQQEREKERKTWRLSPRDIFHNGKRPP